MKKTYNNVICSYFAISYFAFFQMHVTSIFFFFWQNQKSILDITDGIVNMLRFYRYRKRSNVFWKVLNCKKSCSVVVCCDIQSYPPRIQLIGRGTDLYPLLWDRTLIRVLSSNLIVQNICLYIKSICKVYWKHIKRNQTSTD